MIDHHPTDYERALLRLLVENSMMPPWIDLADLKAKGWVADGRNGPVITPAGRALVTEQDDDKGAN